MNLIPYYKLGINYKTNVIHADDWDGTEEGQNNIITLCGKKNKLNYTLLVNRFLLNKVKLCKICLKISYKNGYDLVTTVIKMKLTKETNDE